MAALGINGNLSDMIKGSSDFQNVFARLITYSE